MAGLLVEEARQSEVLLRMRSTEKW